MFSRIVYISHISKHDQLSESRWARQHGPEKGIICFSTYAIFICKFYIFMSFFLNRKLLKKAKAEMPQVNKSFALLMINSLHIYIFFFSSQITGLDILDK